jgi:hypothetical protein
MVRRRASHAVRTIKQRAQAGALDFSDHAHDKMDNDDLEEDDVRQAIVKGDLSARQTRGGRGTRFVIRGPALDGRDVSVVCRLRRDDVRIVTVFRVE